MFHDFGPYKVIKRLSVVAYELELPQQAPVHPIFHIIHLWRVITPKHRVLTSLPQLLISLLFLCKCWRHAGLSEMIKSLNKAKSSELVLCTNLGRSSRSSTTISSCTNLRISWLPRTNVMAHQSEAHHQDTPHRGSPINESKALSELATTTRMPINESKALSELATTRTT
jgi:hypothetical protein